MSSPLSPCFQMFFLRLLKCYAAPHHSGSGREKKINRLECLWSKRNGARERGLPIMPCRLYYPHWGPLCSQKLLKYSLWLQSYWLQSSAAVCIGFPKQRRLEPFQQDEVYLFMVKESHVEANRIKWGVSAWSCPTVMGFPGHSWVPEKGRPGISQHPLEWQRVAVRSSGLIPCSASLCR